ncbi:hypothetical protein [Actinoallomurus sp. CA-150999]|uniref:hypothetical protein n=1 Tax=Actinoallomurus sp. CA-150999 TaxID=3239887 RepID=UPI003D92F70C
MSLTVAAAVNVTTGMLTQHWAARWSAATVAFVVVGGGLEALLKGQNRTSVGQRISGTKVGGRARQRLPGPGEQSVTDSEIAGDLDQSQGTGGDGA